MSQNISAQFLSLSVLEARTRRARENVERLKAQRAQGITKGPPSELEILRERARVRPHSTRYVANGPLSVSLLDLADNAVKPTEGTPA